LLTLATSWKPIDRLTYNSHVDNSAAIIGKGIAGEGAKVNVSSLRSSAADLAWEYFRILFLTTFVLSLGISNAPSATNNSDVQTDTLDAQATTNRNYQDPKALIS
jgi:hypothetical protein